MKYTYFSGCSAEATASPLGLSISPVTRELDIDLAELEDWSCCGSTPYGSVNKLEAACMAARNLALAEKKGLDLVTPCSNCFVVLGQTNTRLKKFPAFRDQVNEALAVAGLSYKGEVRVRHLAEVLYNEITPEVIGAKVTKSLKGLKVAPYYGCQLVRPGGFDDPEAPHSLDELVASLGADVISWPLKAHCCGSSLIMPEPEVALAGC